MLGNEAVEQIISDFCSLWSKVSEVGSVDTKDPGTAYALRQDIMKQFLASFLALALTSMATERVVAH